MVISQSDDSDFNKVRHESLLVLAEICYVGVVWGCVVDRTALFREWLEKEAVQTACWLFRAWDTYIAQDVLL